MTTQLDYPNQLIVAGTTFPSLGAGYTALNQFTNTSSACGSTYTVCRQTWSFVLHLARDCSNVTSAQPLLASPGTFNIHWAQGCAVSSCPDAVPDFTAALSSDNTCGTLSTQTTSKQLARRLSGIVGLAVGFT